METKQATKWQATLTDNTKMIGGTGDALCETAFAIPADRVKVFTVSHTTYADTVFIDHINNTETWYHNGRVMSPQPTFPLLYTLADGSLLTIDRASDKPGDLIYSQA